MRRFFMRRPSPAMLVGFIALVAALSGTAVALPGVNLVDSGDIKNGQVKRKDLGKNAVNGAKVANGALTGADVKDESLTPSDFSGSVQGPKGDKGDTGLTGPRGPSNAFSTFRDPSISVTPGPTQVASLSVPAGSYVIIAKGRAFEGSATDTIQGSCRLAAGGDTDDILFGLNTSSTVFFADTVVSTVVHTFASPGTITWTCQKQAGAAPGFAVSDRKLTAIQVETLSNIPLP